MIFEDIMEVTRGKTPLKNGSIYLSIYPSIYLSIYPWQGLKIKTWLFYFNHVKPGYSQKTWFFPMVGF
jgi:hypothetical protein